MDTLKPLRSESRELDRASRGAHLDPKVGSRGRDNKGGPSRDMSAQPGAEASKGGGGAITNRDHDALGDLKGKAGKGRERAEERAMMMEQARVGKDSTDIVGAKARKGAVFPI